MLALLTVPTVAIAQPLRDDPELFVGRSYACTHNPSQETTKAAACDNLKRDRAALLQRYRNQPKILAMIAHPERVKRVGYVGIDRYPAPPK